MAFVELWGCHECGNNQYLDMGDLMKDGRIWYKCIGCGRYKVLDK